MSMTKRTYTEAMRHPDFLSRFEYLKLPGEVGHSTFGFHRYLNQAFYGSELWRKVRREVIIRDSGCDLAHPEYPIRDKLLVHHITPITEEDLEGPADIVIDPDNLICVSFETHNAIHYGTRPPRQDFAIERRPGDTTLWKGGIR